MTEREKCDEWVTSRNALQEAETELARAALRNKSRFFVSLATKMVEEVPTGPSFLTDRAQLLGKTLARSPMDEAMLLKEPNM